MNAALVEDMSAPRECVKGGHNEHLRVSVRRVGVQSKRINRDEINEGDVRGLTGIP